MSRSSCPRRTPDRNLRSRPPAFTPVKLRSRRDGWTPQVQCAFLAELYLTGSVSLAAVRVGRSRESAYRLRARKDATSFAAAWDYILAGPSDPDEPSVRRRRIPDWRKVTSETLVWMNETGLWQPVIYRGKMRGIRRKPDNSALLRLLARSDESAGRAQRGPR